MKRTVTAAILALTFLATGCSSGLSEAETTWCTANSAAVLIRAEILFIKGPYDTLAGTNPPSEALAKYLATRRGSDACRAAYASR